MDCPGLTNGKCEPKDRLQKSRANEVSKLLCAVQDLLIPFISAADDGQPDEQPDEQPAIRLRNPTSNNHTNTENLDFSHTVSLQTFLALLDRMLAVSLFREDQHPILPRWL